MGKKQSSKKLDKVTVKEKKESKDTTGLSPFAVVFTDGHYSVLQCKDGVHARERAISEYPTKVIYNISPAI